MNQLEGKNKIMKKIIILISSIFICSVASANEFLLKPKGKYEVGFKDYHWVHGDKNSDRNYICSDEKQDPFYKYGQAKNSFSTNNQVNFCREIMARIYFPITNHGSKSFETIYEPSANSFISLVKSLNITNVTNDDYSQFKTLKTWTYNFNDVSNLNSYISNQFPVLFFSPGNGEVVQDYENYITDLTSQGYIVVGINNPFIGGPVQMPNSGMKNINTNSRIVDRSGEIINKAKAADQDLTAIMPPNDILFAIEKTFQNIQIPKKGSIFSYMDKEKIGLFGHSGGANASVIVSQNSDAVEKYNLKAVSSLDTGYGVFASANCVSIKTGQDFTNPTPPTLPYGDVDTVGTSIPFMHFHSAAQGYGCLFSANLDFNSYLNATTVFPDNLKVHNKNEYWVFMGSQNVYDSIPTAPQEIPITLSPDVFYSAHHNFNDYGTLQYLPLFEKAIAFSKEQIPFLLDTPLLIGTGDGKKITTQIRQYLKEFFNQYLKNKGSSYLQSCKPVSSDTLLSCKNANE
jgi:hypothetical protein